MNKPVTQDEIIEALEVTSLNYNWRHKLISRIKAEGIAPPEGFMVVKKRKPCVASCQRFYPDGVPCDCQE